MRLRWKECVGPQFGYPTSNAMVEVFFHNPIKLPSVDQMLAYLKDVYDEVDIDGDSETSDCTVWTIFWCRSRRDPSVEFEIGQEGGGLWKISSTRQELLDMLSVLFAQFSNVTISQDAELTKRIEVAELTRRNSQFPFEQAFHRLQ